ncbi:MAG: hypothetical protein WBE45_20790 [Terriglobales bacterium]|jgi:hypothetical protein
MTNAVTLNEKSGSANHLKNIFDQSLAILCGGASSVRVRRSSLPLHVDAVNLQKRALSDAADALTALWKISGTKSPKLQSRSIQGGTIQYSR